MKEYKKPVLEIINIDGDVITASGCDPDFVKCVEKCVVCCSNMLKNSYLCTIVN